MPGDDLLNLGTALRALRRQRDISQRQLAELAGFPVSTVARIESGGITNPRFRTVERLARAAGGATLIGAREQGAHEQGTRVPHEGRVDGAERHYPAHLDVRVTYPFVGKDRRVLPPGTAEHTFYLDRHQRDLARARETAAADLPIERFDRPAGAGWLWLARTDAGAIAGRLGAVPLPREVPDRWPRPEVILCGLEIVPGWRDRGLERRLLAHLGRELTGRGPIELVTLAHHGPEAEAMRRLGFHSRVRTVSLLTAAAIGWEA
jgi:transcriptional regulator with XRE-family HTH domain